MKLALVAGGLLIGLAACESLARWLSLSPDHLVIDPDAEASFYRYSDNPRLVYELRANLSRDLFTGRTSTNEQGLRDRPREIPKPADVQRIVLLGDSVTEGIRVTADGDTISARLENQYADKNLEVLNLAVCGYNTLAEVELLRTKGLQFDPDTVVLIFVNNDFFNYNLDPGAVADIERPWWPEMLFRHSHFWRFLCLRFGWWDFGKRLVTEAGNHQHGRSNVVEAFEALRELANRHRFNVLVAVWPDFHDNGISNSHPMPDGSDELIVERLARMNGFPVLRLSRDFERHWQDQHPDENPRTFYTSGGDGMHPLAHTSEVAATALRKALAQPVPNLPYESFPDEETTEAAVGAATKLE